MAEKQASFTFQHLAGKKFPSLEGKEENESYFKWSIKNRVVAQTFSFDQAFQPYQKDEFALAFFQDPEVLRNLKVVSKDSTLSPIGIKAGKVKVEVMQTSEVSMAFFDRLRDDKLVKDNGYIQKCYDEYFEDMLLSTEISQMLVLESSDHYSLYNDTEREELIFAIFRFLVLGGKANQYDNEIDKYDLLTKKIYKDLVSVQKDSNSGEIRVTSHAFKVTAFDEAGRPYYPAEEEYPHIQDFSYLVVDPLKRHATVLHHRFGYSPSVL